MTRKNICIVISPHLWNVAKKTKFLPSCCHPKTSPYRILFSMQVVTAGSEPGSGHCHPWLSKSMVKLAYKTAEGCLFTVKTCRSTQIPESAANPNSWVSRRTRFKPESGNVLIILLGQVGKCNLLLVQVGVFLTEVSDISFQKVRA